MLSNRSFAVIAILAAILLAAVFVLLTPDLLRSLRNFTGQTQLGTPQGMGTSQSQASLSADTLVTVQKACCIDGRCQLHLGANCAANLVGQNGVTWTGFESQCPVNLENGITNCPRDFPKYCCSDILEVCKREDFTGAASICKPVSRLADQYYYYGNHPDCDLKCKGQKKN